jgi:23S rRNA (guanosine2251-2'-O)-methyltransferase
VATEHRQTPGLRSLVVASAESGVPLREVRRADLDRVATDHHGVAARVAPLRPLSDQDLRRLAFGPGAVVVVLDGVTDPQNLGAAARSAEAAGVDLLVTRERRSAPVTAAAVRASAGALLHLPHARVVNVARTLRWLANEAAFTVVGLDEEAPASIYDEPCPPGRVVLVVGSEGAGMSRLVRESCDRVVRLPMRGRVSSLNAAASLAAALYGYVLPPRSPPTPPR